MIYTIKIDSDVEERLKEFNAKLPADQKVVSMVTSPDYLFVTVEKKEAPMRQQFGGSGMMLLQDHMKRGQHKT